MQAKAIDPIALLRDIEKRATSAAAIPRAQSAGDVWRGIGFCIGESRLVTPMSEVSEVMHCPKLARVPGAKDWLMGIANLRGNLMPVANLRGFLCGSVAPQTRDTRILVIECDEILSGLMVDQVFGVKHFLGEHGVSDAKASQDWLSPYVVGAFRVGEEQWEVFDVHSLIGAPAFMQVAA